MLYKFVACVDQKRWKISSVETGYGFILCDDSFGVMYCSSQCLQ